MTIQVETTLIRASRERGNRETQMADVLSPLSRKKTGRAYVALARAHSEKYRHVIISVRH